jgi:hypothetical protein
MWGNMTALHEGESAQSIFEKFCDELERFCQRDAKDLHEYRPFFWEKILALHNVTHADLDDCVQIIMMILIKGCQEFYKGQHRELIKYTDPKPGDVRWSSRAKISTWLFGHLEKKYNSLMSSFFAPIRAFESGRVRIANKDGSPGTQLLIRSNVDEPESPISLVSCKSFFSKADCSALLDEFSQNYGDVIRIIKKSGKRAVKDSWVADVAFRHNMPVGEFVRAVVGLYGLDRV